ncbi:unnamed protein product [Bursaphelenchus okinawaensis]|uniref:Uncharacterized protein n=1 Tax=Bursaphelenchus okinawaensis TaxID=465554 RepID=A0A811L6M9_9BILA|nr:unnamed protein product [Bursaphelenchus okinawaensis]CAG9119055.1 unnamed protein product [Bursaphelenchus okinawaensis]
MHSARKTASCPHFATTSALLTNSAKQMSRILGDRMTSLIDDRTCCWVGGQATHAMGFSDKSKRVATRRKRLGKSWKVCDKTKKTATKKESCDKLKKIATTMKVLQQFQKNATKRDLRQPQELCDKPKSHQKVRQREFVAERDESDCTVQWIRIARGHLSRNVFGETRHGLATKRGPPASQQ